MQNKQSYSQNDRTPLISFIVTCYNIPVWMLIECIESITSLSLRPFEREIIIVDDGSDMSPINDLSDFLEGIVYIRQPNKGPGDARNTGIKMATGKYIQFVDGDDKLSQTAYEHCIDIVRYKGAPDMVMFNFTNNSNGSGQMRFDDTSPICGTEYMQHNNVRQVAWGYIFKRTILGELRFTPEIYHEDEEFTPQLMLRAETVYSTSAEAYIYRRREGSIMSSDTKRSILKRLNDKKTVIIRLNDMIDSLPHNDKIALQRRVAQITMDYIYNIITQTRSRKYLDRQLDDLHSRGLFPLPDKNYTRKYTWFRRMTNSRVGLSILMRTLPLMKEER